MPKVDQKYCQKLVRSVCGPKNNKIGTCKKVGICHGKNEIEDSSVAFNDIDYANEGYTNAQNCENCVMLVEAMKDKAVQVNKSSFLIGKNIANFVLT
jgi:hypothetical protein